MKIAIVNDMSMAVEALRRCVTRVPGYEVAWVARDGAEAVQRCAASRPDLILMDLIMPVMDGAEATRQIMRASPCAILVVTATVDGNFGKVYEAMGHGALDAVNTPVLGEPGGEARLLEKIELIGRLIRYPGPPAPASIPHGPSTSSAGLHPFLVLLGASTGGPQALADILALFPEEFNAAVVIIQHVDEHFAPGLAAWLGERSRLKVALAAEGARPKAGTILLAGKDDHLVMSASLSLQYTPDPIECPYRPSVDVFFKSVAEHWPERAVAALLTGMGRDGAAGLLALRKRGWHTIAQDEASCVVYGMPKAAAEIGGATEVLPLRQIAPEVLSLWEARKRGKHT
ncbi:MAG: chemotaxis response regulator protein-glutamate methylesterase [Planctomycetota bacterium]|nr:chemotaxis response regulator protein-glutamate methylesterase [Planctomycetota bacterium]